MHRSLAPILNECLPMKQSSDGFPYCIVVTSLGAAGLGATTLGAAASLRVKIMPCWPRRSVTYRPHISANHTIDQSAKHGRPIRPDNIKITLIKGISLSEKVRPPVGVMELWLSLLQVGQHARNRTGILDQSGGKPAELRLMSGLRRHAKNNAQ